MLLAVPGDEIAAAGVPSPDAARLLAAALAARTARGAVLSS